MPPRISPRLARDLGERLREVRQLAGLTQERLAWECDLAKPFLSLIESGKRMPSIQVLFVLARRLGVEAAELLMFGKDKPRPRKAARKKVGRKRSPAILHRRWAAKAYSHHRLFTCWMKYQRI